jgi:hypothetical protein
MIKLIVESSNSVVLKSVNSDGTWYFVKSATKNKTFWSKSISNVNEFAKKESALNKLYTVLRRLPENAFYDDEDELLYGIEDADELKNAKFAKFYIVDTNGNEIEDVSAEVRKHLLSDDEFISGLIDDLDESVKRFTESSWDDDEYTDENGYLTEEHADYLECNITLTLATFSEDISRIREYIIEDVCRSDDYNRISLSNYKMYNRDEELVDIDGDPYEFDGQEVVDLVVRFCVDENGEYDFNEYGMDEAIRSIRRYLFY